jgi:hypothetical protein
MNVPLAHWILVSVFMSLAFCGFHKVGSNPGSTLLQINNVGAGSFDPKKISNWQYDLRYPLISPQNKGSCPKNIYNANCVHNGGGTWNIYFGGWDGVSSCHDSVSIVVTEDAFSTFGAHYPMIATGSVIHVNNPSVLKLNQTTWLMVTTQLQVSPELNKPALSRATTGIDWTPNQGGVPSADISVTGYPPGWANADVNGGNVIFAENSASNQLHLFFIDFKTESTHSVYRAVADGRSGYHNFQFQGVALEEPYRVVNDFKKLNGYYLMVCGG